MISLTFCRRIQFIIWIAQLDLALLKISNIKIDRTERLFVTPRKTMKKTSRIILVSAVLLLVITGDVFGAKEVSQRLIFIESADLHGKMEPSPRVIEIDEAGTKQEVVGGIARIATAIKNIEQSSDHTPVITLSAGDNFLGKYFNFFNGNATLDLMNLAGFDIFSLGNHEFNRGADVLAKSLENNAVKALCSDLVTADTTMAGACAPYYIQTFDDVRVGFFSLMIEDFSSITNGENVRIKDSNVIVAKQMVQLLKEQGADLVVALTHIGLKQDRLLAASVEGIDIIFGGHSHTLLFDYERVGQTLLCSGGEKGDALVYLDVSLDQHRKIIEDSIKFRLIPITEEIVEDEAIKLQLSSYQQKMPSEVVLGKTETEWDLRKSTIRSKESTVADLVNDLIREKFKVDIVLNNAGAFRSNKVFPPGRVTNAMLSEIDKFENEIYLLKIKGHYLKEILENSANQLGSGGFLQVSGLHYEIDKGASAQVLGNLEGRWSIAKAGEKVTTLELVDHNGSAIALEPEKLYSLACNGFLVEKMGDNYFWFKQYGDDLKNTYLTLYSLLADAFNNGKTVNTPKLDGRISFIHYQ
ncbi:MAG: 5'-nucleotidase/UDP-sugar diphosphatase [Desulforhopalus sp.]